MEAAGRDEAHRSDGAIVVHRANVVIAEVTREIEDRAEVQIRQAKRIASDLERFVEAATELQASSPPIESTSGPKAARELRVVGKVVETLPGLSRALDRILSRRGATLRDILGDKLDHMVDTVRVFISWGLAYRDQLEKKAADFSARLETDLAADADRQREIASDWSVVDADATK